METLDIVKQANEIWGLWSQMWNGDLEKADLIIEDGFYPNLLSDKYAKPKDLNNAQQVKKWVTIIRNRFQTLKYETLEGPFVDKEQSTLCCHWKATGLFSGNSDIPADVPGTSFLIEGTDILKFKKGKIYDCWTQSGLVTRSN